MAVAVAVAVAVAEAVAVAVAVAVAEAVAVTGLKPTTLQWWGECSTTAPPPLEGDELKEASKNYFSFQVGKLTKTFFFAADSIIK